MDGLQVRIGARQTRADVETRTHLSAWRIVDGHDCRRTESEDLRVSPEVFQNLIVQQPLPVYPPNLLLRGVEGKVLVEILVDETGTPETILSY